MLLRQLILKERGRGDGEGKAAAFPIEFFQGLPFLHLEVALLFAKLCYTFEEKLKFDEKKSS